MELSPTYSPNKRILYTKTKLPAMFWSKDLAKVDEIVNSSSDLFFASGCSVLHFPGKYGEKEMSFLPLDDDSFFVGREVTGFLDLAPGFWFLDLPECEQVTFKLPNDCTFEDLVSRSEEVSASLPLEFIDKLLLKHVSIFEDKDKDGLAGLSVELQYFFGWT